MTDKEAFDKLPPEIRALAKNLCACHHKQLEGDSPLKEEGASSTEPIPVPIAVPVIVPAPPEEVVELITEPVTVPAPPEEVVEPITESPPGEPPPSTEGDTSPAEPITVPVTEPIPPSEGMPPNGLTVLVTGGAGYVGSHSVVELLNNGYAVVVVDNLVNSYKGTDRGISTSDSLPHVPCEGDVMPASLQRVEEITGKTVTFYEADILDKAALEGIFKENKIDIVMHFAALKAVGESCAIPLKYYINNITGTATLLEVMKAYNVKRLVQSSSATVYGTPQFLPFTELHPTGQGCTNPYGKSKYFIEEILKDIVAADKSWSMVLLRYFNPVGAHESGRIGEAPEGIPNNLMPYVAQVAVGTRECVNVFGNDYDTPDGTGVRDYVHVMDIASGHIAAANVLLTQPALGWKVYNLGTGQGVSVLQMIEAFEQVSGKKIKYEIAPRRPGDIATAYSDASLARTELNWQPKRNLVDMCRDMWKWQSDNPTGYRLK